jgi:hypothetical protein
MVHPLDRCRFHVLPLGSPEAINAMARIDWQYSSIDKTARVLMEVNPLQHKNVESLENYIMYLATNYAIECEKNNEVPTITGTGGWYVSFVPSEGSEYDYNVEVTLMSYVIEQYLKSKGLM